MNKEKYDELYKKINDKINSENVVDSDEEISVYTLTRLLNSGMSYYNHYFVDELNKIIIQMNKEISKLFFFKIRQLIPFIDRICPGIDEKGKEYISLYFTNLDHSRIIGKAVIDKNLNINFEQLWYECDKDMTVKYLREYKDTFRILFSVLDTFIEEYPYMSYQWNNNNGKGKENVDDGFNTASLYLEKPDSFALSFSEKEDLNIARNYSQKYGELYDFLEFYRDDISRKMKVNINDLNELYQIIVRNQLQIIDELTGSMKRQ